jgi:hypothetical protein
VQGESGSISHNKPMIYHENTERLAASKYRSGSVMIAVGPRSQQDNRSLTAWYNASDNAARSSELTSRLRIKMPTIKSRDERTDRT